eukprot:TRINITY_DN4244_c0_g1_i13.p1 TRINITY_DN4244_c0_g1~~TRINITY_DN4244_c0_g1_i13.p1  ORF type:complete len:123 (+),score=9.64 TRINITY_DN4244_c0_g1_i13:62-430(+)
MGKESAKKAPIRLWVRAKFLGFKRGIRKQYEHQSLLKLEGVNDSQAAGYYNGKRVAYVYKAKSIKKNTKYRAIWGRIMKAHGNNGVVKAIFKKNLPPQAMGATLRVMLYPQHNQDGPHNLSN